MTSYQKELKERNDKLLFLFNIAKNNGCYALSKIDFNNEKLELFYDELSGQMNFVLNGEIVCCILNFERFVMEKPNWSGSFLHSLSQATQDYYTKKHKTPIQLLHLFVFNEDNEPHHFTSTKDERIDALFNHFK